jgi:S-adenosylmethionine:tRNA ribosyltransferase-isomerase
MQAESLSIAEFSYELPPDRIAKYPLNTRDQSKLLIYRQGEISETCYENLPLCLPENSMLVFNDTKVIEARIRFQKPSGGWIEVFCLEPHEPCAIQSIAMQQKERTCWKCLIGGASKWKKGQILEKKVKDKELEIILNAKYLTKEADHFVIELSWSPPTLSFGEVLHLMGSIPLPPYLKRESEPLDSERYQTIYASHSGSVAAPTAGLHFTQALLDNLATQRVAVEFITLHVGAGTFKPVTTDLIEHHEMHEESFELTLDALKSIIDHFPHPVIPVGTTSLRTLESLYWLGVKTLLNPVIQKDKLVIGQWEPRLLGKRSIPGKEALKSFSDWLVGNKLDKFSTKTSLLISPGYDFKIAKALVTNFHQPRSTLLLLVAALIGEDWRKVYGYALDHEFRFLSYGDGCLLQPK